MEAQYEQVKAAVPVDAIWVHRNFVYRYNTTDYLMISFQIKALSSSLLN